MLSGFIEQEILEGKIWYFGLHTNLSDQETIDLHVDHEAVVDQEQLKQQANDRDKLPEAIDRIR